MAWGALIGAGASAGGGLLQGNANSNAQRQQSTLGHYYQNAYGQISGDEQNVQKNLTDQQFALGNQGYSALSGLGNRLGSPDRIQAGQAAYGQEAQQLNGVNAYMQPYTAQAQNRSNLASPGFQGWGQQAMSQRYGAPLAAQQNLAATTAGSTAQSMYDTSALNKYQQQMANIGYQGQQGQTYANLMTNQGNLQLQQQALADQYTGPSHNFYNEQLLGQGLNTGGQALGAYTSYNSAPPAQTNQTYNFT